ncbi:MAG: class F sortase [Actinomycetota bacterium]
MTRTPTPESGRNSCGPDSTPAVQPVSAPAPRGRRLAGLLLGVIALIAAACGGAAESTDEATIAIDPPDTAVEAAPESDVAELANVTSETALPATSDEAGATASAGAPGAYLTPTEIAARITPLDTATDIPPPNTGPRPVSMSIPSLGVENAPIDAVGVERDGEMEVPGAERVGWYEYGSRPGEAGSAVLAAHINEDGIDGVFRRLGDLEVGAQFTVDFADGTTATYEVVEHEQYNKEQLPFDRVFAKDGPPVVTLVSCGGSFQPSVRSYEDNIVAYAVPVS